MLGSERVYWAMGELDTLMSPIQDVIAKLYLDHHATIRHPCLVHLETLLSSAPRPGGIGGRGLWRFGRKPWSRTGRGQFPVQKWFFSSLILINRAGVSIENCCEAKKTDSKSVKNCVNGYVVWCHGGVGEGAFLTGGLPIMSSRMWGHNAKMAGGWWEITAFQRNNATFFEREKKGENEKNYDLSEHSKRWIMFFFLSK